MPLLFSLGLHRALCAVRDRFLLSERLLAFLDDICVICSPDRVVSVHVVHVALQEELWAHSRIHVHQLWNRSEKPPACWDPTAIVWRGDQTLPCSQQGMKVLGTPLGHPEFVSAQLRQVSECHRVLFERIPSVSDLQAAWFLLLYCAGTGANYLLRALPPHATEEYAADHDGSMRPSAVCWSLTAFLHWRVGTAEGFSHQFSRLLLLSSHSADATSSFGCADQRSIVAGWDWSARSSCNMQGTLVGRRCRGSSLGRCRAWSPAQTECVGRRRIWDSKTWMAVRGNPEGRRLFLERGNMAANV